MTTAPTRPATPARSVMALLQRVLVGGLVLAAGAWLAWCWPRSPAWALAGSALVLCGHVVVLAVEFWLVVVLNRRDALGPPPVASLVRAWAAESLMAVRVFGWRQPFAWRRWPDTAHARVGAPVGAPDSGCAVVLVHGFVCNRGFWNPWMQALHAQGRPCVAVNLEPVFGSIDAYAPVIDEAVRRAHALTGRPPLLVCHSMGGLAARAWLRAGQGEDRAARVCRVVTIGTPHHGTWLARFSHVTNGRQMRPDSAWLTALAASEPPGRSARFMCWHSDTDNIVLPASSARLEGADNRLVRGRAHVELAFDPQVVRQTLAIE